MPIQTYTSQDLIGGSGGAVQLINLLDPVNPQDVATKNYADTHLPTQYSKQVLWETAYAMNCAVNNYTGTWAGISTGPNAQTITKQQQSTGIRVKLGTSCYVNVGGLVYYGVQVNGSVTVQILQFYFNIASNHKVLPWAEKTLWAANYAKVNTTGSMTVQFFVQTQSGLTWSTDTNDYASWSISEVVP